MIREAPTCYSSEQLIKARKMHRAGASVEEIYDAVKPKVVLKTFRVHLSRLGMRFNRLAHLGNTKSVMTTQERNYAEAQLR